MHSGDGFARQRRAFESLNGRGEDGSDTAVEVPWLPVVSCGSLRFRDVVDDFPSISSVISVDVASGIAVCSCSCDVSVVLTASPIAASSTI